MSYWALATFGLLGLVIGVLLELGIESALKVLSREEVKERHWLKAARRFAFGLLGAIFGIWATLGFVLEHRLEKLEAYIESDENRYDELRGWIAGSSVYTAARFKVDAIQATWLKEKFLLDIVEEIDAPLQSIAEDSTLLIRREGILPAWEALVRNARRCFLATNLVPLADWKNVARDATGAKLQLEAHRRGVALARVNLVDPRCDQAHKVLEEKHEEVGVVVLELPRHWLEVNDSLDSIVTGLGSEDLVLVDDVALLKTSIASSDCTMKRAELTFDSRELALARRFFERLLSDAELDRAEAGESNGFDREALEHVREACFG